MSDAYDEQALIPAFRHAMSMLDVATRPSVSEKLHSSDLRDYYSEASNLGLELARQFERMTSDLYELRHQVKLAQSEARVADLRLAVCRAERDRLEEAYIETKIDMQDIARQAADMNDKRNETARFARSLERTITEVTGNFEDVRKRLAASVENNAKLQEAARDLMEERNVAIAANAEAAQRIELLVAEKVNAVKIARRRRNVLLDVKAFLETDKAGGRSVDELLDKIGKACLMVNYATGEAVELVAEYTPDVNVFGDSPASDTPPTEQEISEAVTMPRRLHEWTQKDGSADIVCDFCGVAKWEADMEGGDAAIYCVETGINELAEGVTVGDVMEAKAAE